MIYSCGFRGNRRKDISIYFELRIAEDNGNVREFDGEVITAEFKAPRKISDSPSTKMTMQSKRVILRGSFI